MSDVPPPPPGFTLDSDSDASEASSDAPPAPPPGFTLDEPGSSAGATPPDHPHSITPPNDPMPFGDQVSLSQASNPQERYLYLSHRYGTKNVERQWSADGKPEFVVKAEGHLYRVSGEGGDESFVAKLTGDLPQVGGAIAGSLAGSFLMPGGGTVGGAAVGAAMGKGMTEMGKLQRGEFAKTPMDLVGEVGKEGVEGAVGEGVGSAVGKGVSKLLAGRLPSFITKTTEESRDLTRRALDAGATPSYGAMAPGATHLRNIEVMDQKLSGEDAATDERNMAFVKQELAKTLKKQGMPASHVDSFLSEINGNPSAASHTIMGEQFQEAARAHVEAFNSAVQQTIDAADSHIGVQLKNITDKIEKSGHVNLSKDVDAMIGSAYKDFKDSSEAMYNKVFSMVGDDKVVPSTEIVSQARKIASEIRGATAPTLVKGIVKDMSAKVGKPLSEDDAIMLNEFGIEPPTIPGDDKLTLRSAQRLRTKLGELAYGNGERGANTVQHDYGDLKDAVNRAFDEAKANPKIKPALELMDKVDTYYKKNIAKFQDAKLTQLKKSIESRAPPDPERLVKTLSGGASSTRTAQIRRLVGEDVWKRVQSVNLNKFLNKNSLTDETGKTVIDGKKILEKLKDGDELLNFEAIHGKEDVAALREMAQLQAARQGKFDVNALKDGDPKRALQVMKKKMAERDKFMQENALAIIADPKMEADEAYNYLVRGQGAGGRESRALHVVEAFGINSKQVGLLRQAALEDVTRNASIHAINKSGNNAIEAALADYSPAQKDIFFPGTTERDLKDISKVIKFMFPYKSGAASDTSMAGMSAGSVQHKPFLERSYRVAVATVMKLIVKHPFVLKFIVTGRDEGEPWIKATAALFSKMSQGTAMETEEIASPSQSPQQAPAQPAMRPGQQQMAVNQ